MVLVDRTTDVAITEKLYYYMVVKAVTNDTVTATLTSAAGGADTNGNGTPDAAATYTIKVVDHERTTVQANLGLIRPALHHLMHKLL